MEYFAGSIEKAENISPKLIKRLLIGANCLLTTTLPKILYL